MAEESVNHERNCCSEAKLFSDGPGMDGGAGAAVVLVVDGHDPKILKSHLGSLEDHTTFKAEAVGLSLVLHLLSGEPDIRTATIQLDNQAIIKSLQYHKPKSAQYLVDNLL